MLENTIEAWRDNIFEKINLERVEYQFIEHKLEQREGWDKMEEVKGESEESESEESDKEEWKSNFKNEEIKEVI